MISVSLISVVDDDESVRESLEGLLKSVGFRVEAFALAGDFLNSKALHATACLILDVRMPGMSGPELAQELRKLRPEIKVMYMSAYARDVLPSGVQDSEVPFLNKPFTMRTLALSIVETLRRS